MKITDLQTKDVINIADGRKLGQIHDLDIDMSKGVIRAIVIPSETRLFGWVSGGEEFTIPWRQIVKIGSDVILVRLDSKTAISYSRSTNMYEEEDR
ncbi:YlmC/YmxH family sporulation protein [Risungbinella massiliensis]|uniref:YlmC/YmxH family sporulation protein n=1 Tax=Risungbinella massiliensis TaxID=1329796 RepID=UPI0005CC8E3D|nr:YlmC/YmxH family sporulation protein [Risungbinella massiliensis]